MLFFPRLRTGLLACASLAALWLSPSLSMGQPTASTKLDRLIVIVDQAMMSNPEIQAAEAAVEATQAQLAGATLPLNNPELGLEAERTDVDTYALGISQTLDWHDKQGAHERVAQMRVSAAQESLAALKLTKATELLVAAGSITTQRQINRLAKRRTEILRRSVALAERRLAAGDIPQGDLELARLSMAEAAMREAQTGADLIRANSVFFTLSGRQLRDDIRLPSKLAYEWSDAGNAEATASNHPAVKSAQRLAQVARLQIRAVDQGRKADPTIGLAAGRDDDENLIGFSISIPLHVRNNFRSDVDAARAEALQAEQEAQQAFRAAVARLQAAREGYQLISQAWSMWVSQGQASLKQRTALLETQWRAGEMSTTDYLLQVHQTLETRSSGTELQGERWSTWVEWLSASAHLNDWLSGAAKEQ